MPSAAILPASLAIPRPSNRCLSSSTVLTGPSHFRPFPSSSSFAAAGGLLSPAIIRMGGGPRTFPGGVSKWQWKRMQAKKAKQLLKARLCRERQIYEMRKRAELKAAISELERPWEVVERAPTLFSASADEQVKVLADRFQRPGGFDMWSERDGPQLFRSADDLPSARFFPKGAVHSVKPYGVIAGDASNVGDGSGEEDMRYDDWIARGVGGIGRGRRARRLLSHSRSVASAGLNSGEGRVVDCGSDSEYVVASSTEEGHEMTGGLIRPGGRGRGGNHDSYELELVGSGSRDGGEMAGSFNRRGGGGGHVQYQGHGSHDRGGNRGSYGLDAEVVVAGSSEGGDEMAGGLIRRGGGGGRGRGGNHDSYEMELVGSGSRDGEVAGSFNSRGGGGRLNQHRGGDHVRYQGHGSHGRGGNRGSYGLDAELVVAGSNDGGDEMAGGLIRRGVGGRGRGGNHDSYELELVGAGSRDGGEMAGSFNRRGGGGRLNQHRGGGGRLYQPRGGGHVRYQSHGSHDRGGNRGSYGLDAEDVGAGSRDGREMAGSFDRRSRLDTHRGSLNRRSGGGRLNQHRGGGQVRYQGRGSHGRGGNHGSYGLDAGLSEEGDEMADGLIRRGGGRGRGKNHDSYELEHVGAGSREGGEMAGSFDRRSRLDPHRGSLNRRGGSHIRYQGHGSHGRGGNRGSYGMDAEVVVAGSSEEGDEMAGGLNFRHGSNLDQHGRSLNWRGDDSFNRGGGSFDRRGGRGRDRGQGVRRTGSVSLRPTTELNLEKGGRERSGPKWRDGRSDGFSANRRGRSP